MFWRILEVFFDILKGFWRVIATIFYVIPIQLKLLVGGVLFVGMLGFMEQSNFYETTLGSWVWFFWGYAPFIAIGLVAWFFWKHAVSIGRDATPKVIHGAPSGTTFTKTIDDVAGLRSKLYYRYSSGDVLVIDGQPQHNQNLNEWGMDDNNQRHRYAVLEEECGLVLGMSGTGKTSFLITQLVDWMQSGRSFVVTDVQCEVWSMLIENGVVQKYGYEDIVINPTDDFADAYNMFDEVEDDSDMNELLEIFIPDKNEDTQGYAATARLILKAVLLNNNHISGSCSLPDAYKFIDSNMSISRMLEGLMESESRSAARCAKQAIRSAGSEQYLATAVTTLFTALDFLDNEIIEQNLSKSDVLLRELLMHPKKAIFLQFDKRQKESVRTLYAATVSHIMRVLELTAKDRTGGVFLAIDGIENAAAIPNIADKLSVVRSPKTYVFIYLESLEAINRIYGNGGAEMLMSACSLKVFFRVNDINTAKMVSQLIGTVEVKHWAISQQDRINMTGQFIVRDDIYNEVTGYANKAEPAMLTSLETGRAIIFHKGQSAAQQMPYYKRTFPAMNKDFPEYKTPSDLKQHVQNLDARQYG